MVLQSSGAITFTNIKDEFSSGVSNPLVLSYYYQNDSHNFTSAVVGIPNIGKKISFSQFYSKSKVSSVNFNYLYTNTPLSILSISSGSVWDAYEPDFTSSGGSSTANWISEFANQTQSLNKTYEYIYNCALDTYCTFYMKCDNEGTLIINNVSMINIKDLTKTASINGYLKQGNNSIQINCINDFDGGNGGVLFSCKRISDSSVLFVSDGNWKMN